jgi:N-glycosylase/DNA lyase
LPSPGMYRLWFVVSAQCTTRQLARGSFSRSPRMATAVPLGFHALPLPLAQLSLAAVLKCGQSFRWEIYPLHPALPLDPSHEYRLCLQDRVVCLRQSPNTLFYRSVFPDSPVPPRAETARDAETLLWLKDYFQLDVDLVKLYNEWSEKDPVFAKLRGRFEGIRMLRQDPWENLIS